MGRGLGGVKGIVKDSNNNALKDVGVSVVGRSSVVFKTSKDGEFWRMLLPGEHQLEFTSTCCGNQRVDVTVPTQDAEYNIEAAVVNVVLSKTWLTTTMVMTIGTKKPTTFETASVSETDAKVVPTQVHLE